jgi:sialidase-1
MKSQTQPTISLDSLTRQVIAPATEVSPRNMGADLVRLSDGRLLLGASRWLDGSHDYDASQIIAWVSGDDGSTWSAPFDLARPDASVEAVRMPCFLRLEDGRLACFCRYRTSIIDTWVGMLVCRDESGLGAPGAGPAQWTDPMRISPPAPGRHILLNNRALRLRHGAAAGRILLPVSSPWPWDKEDAKGSDIRSWVLYSDDDGLHWQQSRDALAGPQRGLMEPYTVELSDGRLRLWMRTQVDCQYESVSDDGGVTWSAAAPGPLLSPESPVAVAQHQDSGLLMVVYNHNRRGKHTADRTPLCVAFSHDEGASWFARQKLDPDTDGEGRSFSYPSAHFFGDRAYVTYYEKNDAGISLVLRRFTLQLV